MMVSRWVCIGLAAILLCPSVSAQRVERFDQDSSRFRRRRAMELNDVVAADRMVGVMRRSLARGPTLMVVVVDRSRSARTLVGSFGQHFISGLKQLAVDDSVDSASRLECAMLAFGDQVTLALDPPSDDWQDLAAAWNTLPVDESGREMTFAAARQALERYSSYRIERQYEVIVVIVTDEAGDDDSSVDDVIPLARRSGITVYVVGVPAPFGRPSALSPRVEGGADDGDASATLIRQGPESRSLERIGLGFSGGNSDLELIDSGFGPFALEYLCRASGGQYLCLRAILGGDNRREHTEWPRPVADRFLPEIMMWYAPDYVSHEAYQRLLDENGARRALHQAAQLPPIPWITFPQLDFVRRSEAQLAEDASRAQQAAARIEPAIDELYAILEQGESDRGQLTGRRWQAAFDLAMGRAAAAKARVGGYNAMLAALKRGRTFQQPESTRWVLEPAATIEASSSLERVAEKSQRFLQRVIDQHPGTPWALIADRELKSPPGWKWTER